MKNKSGKKPTERFVPRKTLRNKPCPCGSGTKSKKCCLPKVISSYMSILPKYVRNEGVKSWPKDNNVKTD